MTHKEQFAERYTAAWCSQKPESVASFFGPDGSLAINGEAPAVGTAAITEVARSFMSAFPDLRVSMDGLENREDRLLYRWTLTGTHVRSGRAVRISGFEDWRIGEDGLIAESLGQFDAREYRRQLEGPLILGEAAVRSRLQMRPLINAMERALVEFSAGRVQQPVRTVFGFGQQDSWFGLMPTYVPSLPALGAKLVTVCPGNADRGLGTHQATIVMLDPATGVLDAVMDGRYITEVRTAAVSAFSARYLARKDSRVLGILGSGVQARSHLEALSLVRDFEEVRVWSPSAERCSLFAQETGSRAMGNPESVVRGADIVVTATASHTPVVQSEWVGDGTHVVAVGSCIPTRRELDPLLVKRARLIVDSRAAALKEAGDVVIGIAEGHWTADHIEAELGELPQRRNEQEVTIFKSLGLAVEDVFAAALVLNAG